jgi:hypothetical protein
VNEKPPANGQEANFFLRDKQHQTGFKQPTNFNQANEWLRPFKDTGLVSTDTGFVASLRVMDFGL